MINIKKMFKNALFIVLFISMLGVIGNQYAKYEKINKPVIKKIEKPGLDWDSVKDSEKYYKTPTPSPKPTAKPVVKAVQPTIDPDPPVHCQIHERCGGGTIPLKKSECENMICCGPNNQQPRFITVQECEKWKAETIGGGINQNPGDQKVMVFLEHNGSSRLCPVWAVGSVQSMSKSAKYYLDQDCRPTSDGLISEEMCQSLLDLAQTYIDDINSICD